MITEKRPAPKTEAQQRAEAMKADVLSALKKLTRIVETSRAQSFEDLQALASIKSDIYDSIEFETRR